MSIEENKKLVLKLFEAMSNWDIEGQLDLLADDATWWVIGSIPNVSGTLNKKDHAERLRMMKGRIGVGNVMVPDHLIGEGDWVAAECHVDGKTPKGKDYQQKYHFKIEIKDGKIRRVKAYNDTALIKEIMSDA